MGEIVLMYNPGYSGQEPEHWLNESGARALLTMAILRNAMVDLRHQTRLGFKSDESIRERTPQSSNPRQFIVA